MSATASSLPSWVQEISIIAVAAASVVLAVYRYVKAQPPIAKTAEKVEGAQVVAASFVDSRLLKELIDALREHHEETARIALRTTRSNSELRESIIEATEAAKLQADATLNMLRFINRQNNLKGGPDIGI